MFHLLKRHPIPISAFFRHSLVLTYAFPPETLQPLVPQGLVLDTFRGHAFLAVALVQTEHLRPSFLPAAMGRDFFLSGYRIFTRLAGGTQSKRGLRILRSDTDHPWMVCAGNLLTHYNYHLCQATFEKHNHGIHWTIRTQRSEADLEVFARLSVEPPALPSGSPFGTLAEARRFQPVEVEVRQNTFLDHEPFRGAPPILANAFHVRDVPYQWQRGSRLA